MVSIKTATHRLFKRHGAKCWYINTEKDPWCLPEIVLCDGIGRLRSNGDPWVEFRCLCVDCPALLRVTIKGMTYSFRGLGKYQGGEQTREAE
jgi:hypothetical protein